MKKQHSDYRIIKAIILVSIMAMGLMIGCGQKNDDPTPAPAIDDWEPIQVLNHLWKGFDEVSEDTEPWHSCDYNGGFAELPEGENAFENSAYAWSGDDLYSFSLCYEHEETEERNSFFFRLMKVNTVSMSETVSKFYLSDMIPTFSNNPNIHIEERDWKEMCEEIRLGRVHLVSMDVVEGSIYIFFAQYDVSDDNDWTVSHYWCMETGADLKVVKLIDFADTLLGEKRSEVYSFPQGLIAKERDICFVDSGKKKMFLFTESGELKETTDVKDIVGNLPTEPVGKASDGTPVIQAGSSKGEVRFFTPEGVIYTGKGYWPCSCLDDVGEVFLWIGNDLVRWNIESGKAEKLCGLNGLNHNDCIGIRKTSEGMIAIAYLDGDELCFYRFTVGYEEAGSLSISYYAYINPFIEEAASDYERTHPGTSIEFVEIENPFVNYTSVNLLAEKCKAGDGPDLMLFTTKELVDKLENAGCLYPMSDMISEETKNGLFDSVMELGKTDGDLYGLAYQVSLQCFMVAKDDWSKETWTIRELMDSFNKRKTADPDMERFLALQYDLSKRTLLYQLCLLNIEDTSFIDFDGGSCDFMNQEFGEILEFCKDNADKENDSFLLKSDEQIEQMRSGKAFAYKFEGGLGDYSYIRSLLGKDFIPVGMPSESGQGFIVSSNSFISLNTFSANKDLAADFVEYILSDRCQVRYGAGHWVRKDVIRAHIQERVWTYDSYGNQELQCHFRINSRTVNPLGVDENGDSFVEEYIAIMDKARHYASYEEVRNIITEEADAYFEDGKTIDEITPIIQSRINILLQERLY